MSTSRRNFVKRLRKDNLRLTERKSELYRQLEELVRENEVLHLKGGALPKGSEGEAYTLPNS